MRERTESMHTSSCRPVIPKGRERIIVLVLEGFVLKHGDNSM